MTRRIRIELLILSALLGLCSGRGAAAEPPLSLDELLKEYRDLGLPLPPAGAKLVRYESGGGGIVNDVVQPKSFSLAFEIRPGTKTESPLLLRGTLEYRPNWNPNTREVKPEPDAVKDLEPHGDTALAMAIQCRARGWDKLAQHLLERGQKGADLPTPTRLVRLAWAYWKSRLTEPAIDRAPIAKRLKEIVRRDAELDTAANRALLRSLDLALVPSGAKAGSIGAMIDDLVDYEGSAGTIGVYSPGDRYKKIAHLGFDAVPELLEHLNDDRLTRGVMVGFNNFPSWNLRVKDVVGDLLEDLAGEKLMRGDGKADVGADWLRRQQGYPITPAAAKQWWEKARKVGEEPYLLAHVSAAPEKGEPAGINTPMLELIKIKYPKRIPELYRKALAERPDMLDGVLGDALFRSKLSDDEKLKLFLESANHRNCSIRLRSLWAIAQLDAGKFTHLLLAEIENTPKDIDGDYWCCPESYIAKLASESDDARVWPLLEKVVRRSSVGLRMELLQNLCDPQAKRHRAEKLRLLGAFLDDAALRDNKSSKKFEGPGAGFPYSRIEVRDFAALEISHMLGIDVELKLDRAPWEWEEIRRRAREGLEKELAGKK